MRLIDAEILEMALGGIVPKAIIESVIEKYTVKAIPIEWIKKWEGYEQGMAIVNLKDIVEYWEKENE